MDFRLLDLVLAALAAPETSPAETLAFAARRAALALRRDCLPESDSPGSTFHPEIAGLELGFASALKAPPTKS